MVKIFIVVYLLLNIRGVVTNRCTPQGPSPQIPKNVTEACKSIGDGLILQYKCKHKSGGLELLDTSQQFCCR